MGNIEAPKSKEGALSFEDFQSRVAEALKLMRTRELLDPYDHTWRYGPIRESQDYREGPVYYRADLEKVKNLPEFDNLRAEEQEILASGASKQEIAKYSTVAERAYKRKAEVLKPIEQKLDELRRDYSAPGEYIYEVADILFRASRGGGDLVNRDLEEALLRDKFSSMQRRMETKAYWEKKEKDRVALQEKFGERYREVQKNATVALRAQRMLAELNVGAKTAQSRGFTSSQQMWEHDLEAVQDLRKEVGEDNFKGLEDMNRSR